MSDETWHETHRAMLQHWVTNPSSQMFRTPSLDDAIRAALARLAALEALWNDVGQHIEKAAIGYNQQQIVSVFTDNRELRQRLAALEAELDATEKQAARLAIEREDARQDRDRLQQAQDDLADALEDAVHQACGENGSETVDSMALSSYRDALLLLAKHGRFTVEKHVGRRVVGRWTRRIGPTER